MAGHRQGRLLGVLWAASALCPLCGGCTSSETRVVRPNILAAAPARLSPSAVSASIPLAPAGKGTASPPASGSERLVPVRYEEPSPSARREPAGPSTVLPPPRPVPAPVLGLPALPCPVETRGPGASPTEEPLLELPGLSCPAPVPRENAKTTLPDYVIEPPDILVIDALRLIPKPPYHIEPLDALAIQVSDALPEQPIAGVYPVEPDGAINLLFNYGTVAVAGMTLEEARAAIEKHLRQYLKEGFRVTVSLARSTGMQQIRGEHLVRPDGAIGLGSYGSVYVTGLTIPEARAAIENHLTQFLLEPKISLDVAAFNSKVYYVITDGAGLGEQVIRLPITGRETVLDAVGQINGLAAVSAKWRIRIARPDPAHPDSALILPVDWNAIVRKGIARTNYQILPGDRLYINSQPLVKFDNILARIYAPVERTFGVLLLGDTTVNALQGKNLSGTTP